MYATPLYLVGFDYDCFITFVLVVVLLLTLPLTSKTPLPSFLLLSNIGLHMFFCEWCRANHVLPCRPSGITLDIKKSSHKKLSKWLQSKASAGMVSYLSTSPCFTVFILLDVID